MAADRSADEPKGRERRGYVQLNIRLPESLRREFRAATILEGKEMSEVVEAMIREYLAKRGGR